MPNSATPIATLQQQLLSALTKDSAPDYHAIRTILAENIDNSRTLRTLLLETKSAQGKNVLQLACDKGDEHTIKLILGAAKKLQAKLAEASAENVRSSNQQEFEPTIIDKLITHTDHNGANTIHSAAAHCPASVLAYLLKELSSDTMREQAVRTVNEKKETPLYRAAQQRGVNSVAILCYWLGEDFFDEIYRQSHREESINTYAKNTFHTDYGLTPFMAAAAEGNDEVVLFFTHLIGCYIIADLSQQSYQQIFDKVLINVGSQGRTKCQQIYQDTLTKMKTKLAARASEEGSDSTESASLTEENKLAAEKTANAQASEEGSDSTESASLTEEDKLAAEKAANAQDSEEGSDSTESASLTEEDELAAMKAANAQVQGEAETTSATYIDNLTISPAAKKATKQMAKALGEFPSDSLAPISENSIPAAWLDPTQILNQITPRWNNPLRSQRFNIATFGHKWNLLHFIIKNCSEAAIRTIVPVLRVKQPSRPIKAFVYKRPDTEEYCVSPYIDNSTLVEEQLSGYENRHAFAAANDLRLLPSDFIDIFHDDPGLKILNLIPEFAYTRNADNPEAPTDAMKNFLLQLVESQHNNRNLMVARILLPLIFGNMNLFRTTTGRLEKYNNKALFQTIIIIAIGTRNADILREVIQLYSDKTETSEEPKQTITTRLLTDAVFTAIITECIEVRHPTSGSSTFDTNPITDEENPFNDDWVGRYFAILCDYLTPEQLVAPIHPKYSPYSPLQYALVFSSDAELEILFSKLTPEQINVVEPPHQTSHANVHIFLCEKWKARNFDQALAQLKRRAIRQLSDPSTGDQAAGSTGDITNSVLTTAPSGIFPTSSSGSLSSKPSFSVDEMNKCSREFDSLLRARSLPKIKAFLGKNPTLFPRYKYADLLEELTRHPDEEVLHYFLTESNYLTKFKEKPADLFAGLCALFSCASPTAIKLFMKHCELNIATCKLQTTKDGSNILHAAIQNTPTIFNSILTQLADGEITELLQRTDQLGRTPIHIAAHSHATENLKTAIDYLYDENTKKLTLETQTEYTFLSADQFGYMPLDYAMDVRSHASVNLLLNMTLALSASASADAAPVLPQQATIINEDVARIYERTNIQGKPERLTRTLLHRIVEFCADADTLDRVIDCLGEAETQRQLNHKDAENPHYGYPLHAALKLNNTAASTLYLRKTSDISKTLLPAGNVSNIMDFCMTHKVDVSLVSLILKAIQSDIGLLVDAAGTSIAKAIGGKHTSRRTKLVHGYRANHFDKTTASTTTHRILESGNKELLLEWFYYIGVKQLRNINKKHYAESFVINADTQQELSGMARITSSNTLTVGPFKAIMAKANAGVNESQYQQAMDTVCCFHDLHDWLVGQLSVTNQLTSGDFFSQARQGKFLDQFKTSEQIDNNALIQHFAELVKDLRIAWLHGTDDTDSTGSAAVQAKLNEIISQLPESSAENDKQYKAKLQRIAELSPQHLLRSFKQYLYQLHIDAGQKKETKDDKSMAVSQHVAGKLDNLKISRRYQPPAWESYAGTDVNEARLEGGR